MTYPRIGSSTDACCLQAKKRTMRPQRVSVTGLVGAPAAQLLRTPGQVIVEIYQLTTCAAILHERYSSDDCGYGVGWIADDRRHKETWQQFLTSEQLSDNSLMTDFQIQHRVGPPPTYIRTLIAPNGDGLDNCLALFEHFLHFSGGAQEVLVYNSSNLDTHEWQVGSTLPNLRVQVGSTSQIPPTSLGFAHACLVVRGLAGSNLQLLLQGQLWNWRATLREWQGAYFSKGLQLCEKNEGGTFIRDTGAFPSDHLPGWLATLKSTCMEYELQGDIEAQVIDTLTPHTWLHPKRMV